jgi:transposase
MAKPLSNDLRERLIAAVAGGTSCRAAAGRFGVAASTAVKWMQRWRESGSVAPRPQGGDKRSGRIEAHAAEILALIEAHSDITLAEIATPIEERRGERFAPSTIWRCLDRHHQTFKKNGARQRAGSPRRGRPPGDLARRAG